MLLFLVRAPPDVFMVTCRLQAETVPITALSGGVTPVRPGWQGTWLPATLVSTKGQVSVIRALVRGTLVPVRFYKCCFTAMENFESGSGLPLLGMKCYTVFAYTEV